VAPTTPPSTRPSPAPESRRERQRRELVEEIKAVARHQLESGGRAGVSWRGIAREVGLNPASLYTYFDGLDELFTALLLDSYASLAATTRSAATEALRRRPRNRVLHVCAAYRRWALAHRAQYNLLFTDQIPGYAAPPGGPTVDAQIEVFTPIIEALRTVDDDLGIGPDVSAAGETALVGLFGLLHGLVSLEVNHHLDWVRTDGEQVLLDRLSAALDGLG
jgi:AcrR family transcriptional regulator